MKTTVMFVSDSEPLSGTPVRMSGGEDVLLTDDEGKVEVELDLGTNTFELRLHDNWIEKTVHRQGHSPLFVVNVGDTPTAEVTTLNTLQIDLANFVGDRYVFETVLGRGGMGVVVKAIDRMLNRPVAIKMLSEELRENEEAQQIFLVEARNLATLNHPNLVAIHDILNVSGRVLMVFEYVLGENIEQKLRNEGPLGQKEVLQIAIQLLRCVAYLHEHDLIHRDLKPANVIVQADGTVKLIDFGLARSLNELYVRGTRVRGTPAYMAPEQVQGIRLTTGTDIYQLGVSMYEMLTGKLPFASGDLAYAHVHMQPPPIRERVPDLDEELAGLVMGCLEKNVRNRPGSCEELRAAMQAIYARLVRSVPSGPFEAALIEEPPPQPVSGPQSGPTAPTSGTMPSLDRSLSSGPTVPAELEDELDSGSNTMIVAVALVGLLALGIAAFLLVGRNVGTSVEAIPIASTTAAKIDVVPTAHVKPVSPVVDVVPPASFEAASKTVAAAALGAASEAEEQELAEPEKELPVKVRPTKQRVRPRRDVRTKTTHEPMVEAMPEEQKRTPEKPRGGLLSVESGKSNGLLPVNP